MSGQSLPRRKLFLRPWLRYPVCMKRHLALLVLPVLLGAAAPSPSATPQPSPANIHAANGWFRYLLPNIPAGGYMTLSNSGDSTTRLIGASSPACGTLMLHKTVNDGGTSVMEMVKSITIPAHGQVSFAEGGYHLMCMKPKMKVGDKIGITLKFADGGDLLLLLPVYGPSGPSGA